jgi:hypothetical protein
MTIKTTKWQDETRYLLQNRPVTVTYKMIADAIGVTEAWVKLFAIGRTENPGVNTVEAMNNYLKSYKVS